MNSNLFSELWNRRSLLLLFALNDVKARYINSVLGFLWSFLEPLLMLSVLYVVFSNLFKNNIENYPIYLLLGLIVWYGFSRATTFGLSSLTAKSGIISRIYFRREIVVVSSTLTAFIMMGFEFIAFAIFVIAFHFTPSLTTVFLPLLLIDLFILSTGVSLFLAVLNVRFRDIQFIWQILLQAGFFLSPIIYQPKIIPEHLRQIFEINPLVPMIETAHNLVLYGHFPSLVMTAYITIVTGFVFVIGYITFKIKGKNIVEEL